MADKSKAVSSWANFKNSLKQSNVENKKQVLDVEVNKRLEIYSSAQDWEGLTVDPLNHEISKDASAESFQKWQATALPEIEDYFKGVLVRSAKAKPEELDVIAGDIESKIGTIDDAMNNDATGETSDGDSSGAAVTGATDLETIKKILPQLKDKLPNLFKFDEFVKNLAQALIKTEPSNDSDDEEGNGGDADGNFNPSATRDDSNKVNNSVSTSDDIGGLEESLSGIYLTEEGEVSDNQVDNTADDTSGQPLDVADATVLQAELEELRKILEPKRINVEDLLPQDLKDALAGAPKTDVEAEPKTAEQAAVDGKTASGIDARKEQASAIEIYSTLIQPMDDFFSTDQAQRLGFMEQFLLESQSKMLWALIGNLTLIAEKDQAKAFTNRAEKEAAGMSGDGAPEAEVEPTADSGVQAEAFNPFKRDKEPVEISKEDQISLKTDLKALLQTLRATKSMIGSYETNMTKVSVDPGLDGSALKEQLDQYLPMVQKSIAKIVERANEAFVKATELNAPKEEPESSQPADDAPPSPTTDANSETTQEGMINAIFEAMQPALHEMSLMQEDSRDETINFVDSVYKEMRLIYAPVGSGEDSEGLRGFMETGKRAETIQQAERMLELATKEDFIKLFPGGRIGEGGMPATVNAATETMNREIKKLVLIMRDVVTLASKSVIPHSKLVEIVNSLTTISKSLYNSFGAKMMISGESLAQIETRLGEDEGNKSLTDQETKPGMMDKLGNLAGKGLEKLKQAFQWMSEKMLVFMMKHFGGDSKFLNQLEDTDLDDEEKQEIVEKVETAIGFLQNLDDAEEQAVNKLFIDMGKRGAQLAEEVFKYTNVRDFERQLSSKFDSKLKEILFISMNKALSDEERDLVVGIMRNKQDEFVSFMTTFFKIKEKLGEEAAEELIDPSQRNASNEPMDAEVEFEDEDGGDIEGLAKAPSTLKDRAIKMFEKKSSKSAPKPSEKGVSIFDYKSFASLLIFFMGQKNVNEETNAPSGKVNSGKDMETILKDGELSEQFFEVDDSLGGGLTKYAIKKYPFLSGVMSSLSKKFAPHFEKNNIELPNQTRPVQQQSDPSDVDLSADPFGDATNDQEPEEKPESKKIDLKTSLRKISRGLRQKFISTSDVQDGDLMSTTLFLAIAVVNSVMTETPIDPDLGAEVDLTEASTNKERSLFASKILSKMKDKTAAGKIKAFMVDIGKGQKKYANLYKLYSKSIQPPESSYTKLALYLDAMVKKAKEAKEEGFTYKNTGNLTALNADFATQKPKSITLEESLRPIIEKMLNEHYNH